MRVDLFILNYNGEKYVLPCIDSFLQAMRNSKHDCQLIVIDNSSTDQSVASIKNRYPSVRVMSMPNRVLCSFNDVVLQSKADIVFLLNNDLRATPECIDPMVDIFVTHPDTFLVAPKSYSMDGSFEGGKSTAFISLGGFGTTCHFKGFEEHANRFGYTFATGFGAFDRKKFIELKGYDDLYLPGRLEDSDIALRAWRMGWKCFYQHLSVIHHIGAKSFDERFSKKGTLKLAHRNSFLFFWKNISDKPYWLAHIFFVIPRIFYMLLKGDLGFFTGFLEALGKIKIVWHKRRENKLIKYSLSDRQVLELFRHEN